MNVVLFDMDGTLTPARGQMQSEMLNALIKIQEQGFVIGIVSGSDMDYIKEQCDILFGVNKFDFTEVLWLPCNGTKHYRLKTSGSQEVIYENEMKDVIGPDTYKKIIAKLFDAQTAMRYSLGGKDMPLTGTFIQYRGSMINWCPIGRDASDKDRSLWVSLDKKFSLRKGALNRLKSFPDFENIEIRMGGETSFDIFPAGWDKTYALRNFKESDSVWFVGDRCGEDGNDREIFESVKERKYGQSFETSGPSQTILIIDKIINSQNKGK